MLLLEAHFSCLLLNFLLHKKENGNYLMTHMDYSQIRMYICGSNLFEECGTWFLLRGTNLRCVYAAGPQRCLQLTWSLYPWWDGGQNGLPCLQRGTQAREGISAPCLGLPLLLTPPSSSSRLFSRDRQTFFLKPSSNSLFKKGNQALKKSLMDCALPRAPPTVVENTYDAIPWQTKLWVKHL